MAQQIMQVVLVRSKALFLSLHFFLDRNSVTERKKMSFQQFFYSNVPIGVSKRNWRSNRLLPTSWNQKNQRREEAGEPNQRLRFSWPGKPRPMQQQTYSPLDGKTLRKSLLFSDFWCITDLFVRMALKTWE